MRPEYVRASLSARSPVLSGELSSTTGMLISGYTISAASAPGGCRASLNVGTITSAVRVRSCHHDRRPSDAQRGNLLGDEANQEYHYAQQYQQD